MLTKEVMYAVVRLGDKPSVVNKNKNKDPVCYYWGVYYRNLSYLCDLIQILYFFSAMWSS